MQTSNPFSLFISGILHAIPTTAIRRIPQLPDAYLHPWRRESIRRLAALKDIHKGRRAFIIGNGPSLRQTDLSKLRNEFTFGMNRIYLLFPELGFHTTYFVSINDLVIEQFKDEILAQPMPKFLAWRSHRHFSPQLPITQLPTFLYTSYTGPRFSLRCSRPCLGRCDSDERGFANCIPHGIREGHPHWR